jgi:repressor LexA
MTAAQEHETLTALRDYIEDFGYPPSMRELGKILGLSSPDSVLQRLKALEQAGQIERVPGRPRAIRLKGENE